MKQMAKNTKSVVIGFIQDALIMVVIIQVLFRLILTQHLSLVLPITASSILILILIYMKLDLEKITKELEDQDQGMKRSRKNSTD